MANAAGTLYIVDGFSHGSHGRTVAASAADAGFRGPVVQQDIYSSRLEGHNQELFATSTTADQFQQAFHDDIVGIQMAELKTAATALKKVDQAGAHDGAVNMSEGMSQASTVQGYYDLMRRGWDPEADTGDYAITQKNDQGRKLLHNFAAAHGLDEAKLLSSKSDVSGPERGKLQQMLVSDVTGALGGNSDLVAAKADYDAQVDALSRHRVSVVVASENAGGLGREFKQDAGHSAATRVRADFFNNPLSNANTLTVGALNAENTKVAAYSTRQNANLYASGTIETGGSVSDGTSFAAPRVAAALARAHQLNPGLSNQDVVKLVQATLTRPVDGVTALDAAKARTFFTHIPGDL